MSIESDFFGRYRPAFARLEKAGFRKTETGYTYEEDFLAEQFRARLHIDDAEAGRAAGIRGEVVDMDTGEEYLPIRAQLQRGSFVGSVREAYLQVLARVREACFVPVDFLGDQTNRLAAWIAVEYGDEAEFPWEKYPGNGTFKCPENGKWYGIIMPVAFGKLTKAAQDAKDVGAETLNLFSYQPEDVVEVINLKADPAKIPQLTRRAGIFPAWHMNKKHWISVILDDTLEDEEVADMIRSSHELVEGKKSAANVRGDAWIIPSDPKIYDVDAGFAAGAGSIEWHQHNNIHPGDEVYIYSTAPNSAILYRCVVEASDLPYHGMFVESKGYQRSMRIRLQEKYPKDRYPLSFMKANGGSVVRSARRMPAQLLEAMRRVGGR